MPYSYETLSNLGLKELKNLYQQIIAHKSALSDEDVKKGYKKETLENKREKIAKEAGRMDLIFDSEKYNSFTKKIKKKNYLIDEIIKVQNSPFIGKYEKSAYVDNFDYVRDIDDIKAIIDPVTGHVKYSDLAQFNKKKEEEKEEELEPSTEAAAAAPSGEEAASPSKPYPELPTSDKGKKESKIVKNVAARRKARFDEDADHFKELNQYLSSAGTLTAGAASAYELSEVTETQKEMLSAIIGMNHNVNRKDKNEVNQLREMIGQFAEGLSKRMSNDVYSREESGTMIKSLELLKQFEKKVGGKEIEPIINRIIDKRDYKPPVGTQYEGSKEMFVKPEQKPLEPFGGLQSQKEVEAPYLSTKSDKAIGDVRQVGFIGAQDQLAKVEDVTLEPSERSKSLKRFTNFRWVQSVQNSDLGYASPFQRMDDIDDRRRFGKCFMHGNKMPKDPDTQDELDKAKAFNTYSLVPSFDMSSRMQPATPLSFINSTSKFARKLTADEMEPINQGKRNVNNDKNKLEFTTILHSDDPLRRIKDKYKNNIIC
jgi:hypothetical protein